MSTLIKFDATFHDYYRKQIFDKFTDINEIYISSDVDTDKLMELISSYFEDCTYHESISYNTTEDDKNIKISGISKCLLDITNNFSITFSEFHDYDDNDKLQYKFATNINIYYSSKLRDTIHELISKIKNILFTRVIENTFFTIGVDVNGFKLISETVNIQKDFNLELNYGNKFTSISENFLEVLRNETHGLMLFYGLPGGGKSSYIRYIISQICNDKTIIYVPAFMMEQLANPEFMTFLQNFKESILILEDAELVLQSRNEDFGAQGVSNLLNLTNGLLNDATKIQVIATFNMDKKNIDKALLRPGRLVGEYKFDKLSIDESKLLATHLNKNMIITAPMTIAEIYSGKTNVRKSKKRIGIKEEEE